MYMYAVKWHRGTSRAPGQYQAHVGWHARRREPMEEPRQPRLERLGGHCRFRAVRQINAFAHPFIVSSSRRVVGAHFAHVILVRWLRGWLRQRCALDYEAIPSLPSRVSRLLILRETQLKSKKEMTP